MRTEIVLVVFAVFFIAAPGCGGTGVETSKGLGPDLSADMGADTAVHIEVSEVAPEVDVLDLRADLPDAMPDIHQCLEKPFELFCPCQSDAECASGYCIQVPTGIGGGKVCTMACVEDCPEGWQCALVAGSCPDCTFVCIPWGAVLCHPCHEHSDCGDPEVESPDLCVPYGPQGRFCGADCGGGKKCPDGYVCQNVQLDGGAGATQCVLADGECECSEEDIANETSTICFHADLTGNKCFGLRVCTADGLSECDAQTPVPETCNGKDDDCDGWLDEATCDDENSCTDNVCDPVAGCQFPPNESACEDGDPCTSGDKCTQGKCEGGINVCPCMKDDDCPGLGFVGGCVGKLFCDTSAMPHGCKVDPAGATPCAAPANQCKAVTCNVATGQCDQANKPELTPCDDGDACTAFDWCEGGACVGGQLVHCSDGNSCTEDGCSAESGCTYMPLSGVACTDGDPCTDGDSCVDGECVVGPSMSCDDGNLCTDDACVPGTGCKHVANQLPCNDANVCTLDDVCAAGWCMSKTLLKCDDGNPCTDDVCDPLVGCISTVNMKPCSDGNACTSGDKCKDGVCQPGAGLSCDDGDLCTTDTCTDPVLGTCVHEEKDCKDYNCCTWDYCNSKTGECYHPACDCSDNDPCTVDIQIGCPDNGTPIQCKHEPMKCDDVNACTNDVCNETTGGCSYVPADCDDKNKCTLDSCSLPSGVCLFVAKCDDANVCTDDSCAPGNGACANVPHDCDDGNICTQDGCDGVADKGCTHDPVGGLCDDLDACTDGDVCAAGMCKPGAPTTKCDDANPCTDDSCDPQDGCINTPNAAPCDDGNPCNGQDTCDGGACLPGTGPSCDDNDPCTDDGCDGGVCTHAANLAAPGCSDWQFTPVVSCLSGSAPALDETGTLWAVGTATPCDQGDAYNNDRIVGVNSVTGVQVSVFTIASPASQPVYRQQRITLSLDWNWNSTCGGCQIGKS